ncbi:hypothetical protein NDGK_03010 [Clostridiales bacterium CHKCI001]|nr:hypothetical protein NDGK_03010 [Clostridiales bacterium CHKCI001]
MKKILRSVLAITMGVVMLMPLTAFAEDNDPTLISTQ